MNEEKSPQPQAEQLLKMLDIQLAAVRERRSAKGAGRSNAGLIGLVVIVAGAAVALWILMEMLEQMRPQRQENQPPIVASETK
jgi:hypothetical protein